MQTIHKCCKCGEIYEWYGNIHEREDDKTDPMNTSIKANALQLVFFEPTPDRNEETLEVKEAEGNLAGTIINLCPKCMREFLLSTYPSQDGYDCFHEV